MMKFLRKTFGNGYRIAIGNKICIGIFLLLAVVFVSSLWESCGYPEIETAKENQYNKLQDDLADLVERNAEDADILNLKAKEKTLKAEFAEVEKKYLPYRTELTNQRKAEVAAAKAAVAKSQAQTRARKELEEKFKLQFSAWNGSHYKTVKYVKALMHDPKSFKHVETRYTDVAEKGYRIIRMTYRGKNMFNAVVTNSIMVKVDLNGNVMEVLATQ